MIINYAGAISPVLTSGTFPPHAFSEVIGGQGKTMLRRVVLVPPFAVWENFNGWPLKRDQGWWFKKKKKYRYAHERNQVASRMMGRGCARWEDYQNRSWETPSSSLPVGSGRYRSIWKLNKQFRHIDISAQRWHNLCTVGSVKRCCHCILGFLYYAWLRLKSYELDMQPFPQNNGTTVQVYKLWSFSFELAE